MSTPPLPPPRNREECIKQIEYYEKYYERHFLIPGIIMIACASITAMIVLGVIFRIF